MSQLDLVVELQLKLKIFSGVKFVETRAPTNATHSRTKIGDGLYLRLIPNGSIKSDVFFMVSPKQLLSITKANQELIQVTLRIFSVPPIKP